MAAGSSAHAGGNPTLATVRVATGLEWPVYVTHAPNDPNRLFILEKRGRIRILDLTTNMVLATPFLDIDSLVGGGTSTNDERGLLGLAFHPDYQSNGFFYVNYTNNSSDTIIQRYTVSANPDIADAGSGFTILFIDQPYTNHNGGWIDFGPNDGYLYIATGDGGNGCDPGGRAQDITDQLLGKLLRIDVDGGSPYAIPPDNPFVGTTGDDEIWAYGLRNPWRCCFDRANGDLYIADVGQVAREEISYQPGGSTGRENYGWRCMEGNLCSSASGCNTSGCTCFSDDLTDPFHDYARTCNGGGYSITGGYVYRGCAIPDLDGTYFFGDYVCGNFWSLRYDGNAVSDFTTRTSQLSPSQDGFSVNQVSSFGEDVHGEIYIVDQGSGGTSGQVFKIIADAGTGSCCLWDLDGSGTVGTADLLELLSQWGTDPGGPPDFDGDGNVGTADLLELLSMWGPCP